MATLKDVAKLACVDDMTRAFFVRAKAGAEDVVKAAFPGGESITIPGRTEDFGYFTGRMTEKKFAAKYDSLGDKVLGRIRME